ncbi:uncharacterized protein si:ch211-51h4.2 [Ictalurus furcatus]|uniref:uncharacterized protein si:ch211-51h4.2 n=1 Tax=Ictalurus furcatus TaxID=66913 RepID=UPI002350C382|nr:uncharacterized protein si:ch211-51h4.2 [Ictalurus furcatus]
MSKRGARADAAKLLMTVGCTLITAGLCLSCLTLMRCWTVVEIVPQMAVESVLEKRLLNTSLVWMETTRPAHTFIYSNISLEESEKAGEIAIIPLTKYQAVHVWRIMDSTRCWKHSFEILVHVDMIASHNSCRFQVYVQAVNLLFYHIPKMFYWIQIW